MLLHKSLLDKQNFQDQIARNWSKYKDLIYPNGTQCPHCKRSTKLHIHANYKDQRRRYKCLSCNKTFNEFTSTTLHRKKFPEKWQSFLESLCKGYSVRKLSKEIGVSHVTIGRWKKLWFALVDQFYVHVLDGKVEVDFMELPSSSSDTSKRGVVLAEDRSGMVYINFVTQEKDFAPIWLDFLNHVHSDAQIIPHQQLNHFIENLPSTQQHILRKTRVTTKVQAENWTARIDVLKEIIKQVWKRTRGVFENRLKLYIYQELLTQWLLKHLTHGKRRDLYIQALLSQQFISTMLYKHF